MADGYDSPRIRSDSVHKRKACCYYVTGHGYGHATRAIGIMGELLSRGYLVNIISALNSDFFLKNIPLSDQNRSHLTYIQRCIDSGAIQSDPISVDSVITLRNYYQNIHSRYDELLAKEIMFLKIQSIDVVLVDASPIACSAAKACNIPSIIISNFTWSFIYENLLPNTAHLLTDTEVENFSDMVVQCNIDTANADYVLLLPGETDMPFAYAGNIIPSPLVHRRPMNSKEDVRRNLNIPMDAYMVVLGFGGHKLTAADFRDEMLPHNWVCVVLQANGLVFDSPRFIGVSNDAYVPDLVAAADVVLGKLGYGMMSECLALKTPIIFIPRSNWPEEKPLINIMRKYGAEVCMQKDEYYSGNWKPYLEAALEKKKKSWDVSHLYPETAIERVADSVNKIIETHRAKLQYLYGGGV